jgi:ketosteroid isomerase-like protein
VEDIRAASARVYREFSAGSRKRDAEALARLYDADARLMPPGGEVIAGNAAVLAFYRELMATTKHTDLKYELLDIGAFGDTGFEAGRFTFPVQRPDGSTVLQGCKHLLVCKAVEGVWKVHIDMWSDSGQVGC